MKYKYLAFFSSDFLVINQYKVGHSCEVKKRTSKFQLFYQIIIVLDEQNSTEQTSAFVFRLGKSLTANTVQIKQYKSEFCVTMHICMSDRFIRPTFKVSALWVAPSANWTLFILSWKTQKLRFSRGVYLSHK